MRSKITNIINLIGSTPMVALKQIVPDDAIVFAKLEMFNPGSSVKDRIAMSMIEEAEKYGGLKPGMTIVEPTSGNTGIGLAVIGKLKGYKVVLTMPESMSVERRKLLRSLGAEIVLTDSKAGMLGAIAEAERQVSELGGYMPKQFENPANPRVHYKTTGPEIWKATGGQVDVLVAGVGTGGTISGAGKFLKEKNPNLHVVAVEPAESAVISGEPAGPHMIQGIGAGFLPKNLDMKVVDEAVKVSSADAVTVARRLSREECLLVGISSGAAAHAALEVASRPAFKDKTIVVIFPDTSERYASTLLFGDE
ncbi:MAG: cysteine synthase A [Deltaproteobacteria bacterium]|nr:cysteine synthase A [Deltaproteobacteria bacterium]MBN2670900.1 cysteine synthase A [Deltaproteobacteria bacterium]